MLFHSHMVCPRALSQYWIARVKLKLNPEKTEFIIIGDRQARESLINHITNMCHTCYFHLKDVRCICKFLSVETAALLANSMISSRLDYCNSLLYGVSKYNVAKLQKIQNALCTIVLGLIELVMSLPFFKTTLAHYLIPQFV